MYQSRAMALAAILMGVAGCATSKAPPQAPPAIIQADDYNALKTAYLSAVPDARVGRVAAVLPAEQRLAVGDIPVADFHKGDVISVVDAKLNAIADGTVVDLDADMLYVHYDPVTVGSPQPLVGDLAIRAEAPPRPQ
jgi:hypothetical protein